jgi:hypothetical protein
VTFTASVTTWRRRQSVTGNVEFRDGDLARNHGAVRGRCRVRGSAAARHGHGAFVNDLRREHQHEGSSDPAINHVVNKATPVLTLVSNPNPSCSAKTC